MGFLKRFNPKPGVEDFISEFSRPNPYRWRILAVSVALTFTIFSVFTYEGAKGPPVLPEVTYITSWADDRTDAEILASNIENQRLKDERAAMMEESLKARKEMYRALGRASGMDVDAIEDRIENQRAERLAPGAPQEGSAIVQTE
ncbi:hypothetical protein [Altererythrobacter aquiaggeris]|uniref:hypothetical protein n=1 Tax=Aestuarierythrobacter aquiaggeris TaxID=1898396 RepID=UPI0030185528